MADVAIKPEIKVDPAESTPSRMEDIEKYEDAPALEIPEAGGQAWLVKLPKYLWQHWADIYRNHADDEPIEIGKMRVKASSDPDQDPLQQQIQIRLMPGVPQHRGLPMSYDVKLKTNGYSGNVVFSERDEGGGRRNQIRGISKQDRYSRQKRETKSGTYSSALNKHTALAPIIQHVADAVPHHDDSYSKFTKKQFLMATRPKRATTFVDKLDRSLHPSAAGGGDLGAFNAFGLSSRPSAKKKAPKEKAVRISQGELLDALDKCFRRYKYWSLKALRNELKQPEAYIKQTLEQIAVLVRSGDFSMTYMLKPEYQAQNEIKDEDVKQEHVDVGSDVDQGPEEESGSSGSGEESDDEDGFEDVQMDG